MGFTPNVIQSFLRLAMGELATDAQAHALTVIPSEQLKEKLRPRVHSPTEADLFLTPYWALFVHDGHGTIAPTRARFLVYYADKADDPRRPGGQTPDRLADERRLTAREFQQGLAENRRRQQTNPAGGPNQFMIVVRDKFGQPQHTGPVPGVPFFEVLMAPFEHDAEGKLYGLLDDFVLREMREEFEEGTQRPIKFRLP